MKLTATFFLAIYLAILHLGQCWKYCNDWRVERDNFSVKNFLVEPRSLNSVEFKLKGITTSRLVSGGDDDSYTTLSLKLFESDSGKLIYSDRQGNICDFADCPYQPNQVRVKMIKVIDDLDENLQRNVRYTGEIRLTHNDDVDADHDKLSVACVQDSVCISKNTPQT